MPIRSQAQWGFLFATGKPFARRWARETPGGKGKRFRNLPTKVEDKDAGTSPGAALHGPGGLLSTPGMRGGKRWKSRLKAKKITGNLYRANDGKFTAGSGGDSATSEAPEAPKAKPSPKAENAAKRRERAAAEAESRAAEADAEQAQRDEEDAKFDAAEKPAERAKLRREIAKARRERAAELRKARAERQAAERQARADEDAGAAEAASAPKAPKPEKPKKGGGGGGKGKPEQASPDEKRAQQREARSATARETAASVGLSGPEADFLRGAAEGNLPPGSFDAKRLMALGLVADTGDTTEATDQGRRALAALERGDVRGYQAALQDAKAGQARRQAAEAKRTAAEAKRTDRQQRELSDLATRAQTPGLKLTDSQWSRLVTEGLAEREGTMIRLTPAGRQQAATKAMRPKRKRLWRSAYQQAKSAGADATTARLEARRALRRETADRQRRQYERATFAIFKAADGAYRWIARSTTAFKDRDGEILSEEALVQDAERMSATGQYGPLRYWHVGEPDPTDLATPWGPGLDLGMCDFSTVIGRTAIESGTFADPAIGAAIAGSADQYELSPGFFYPPGEPDATGVFHTIRRFERSLVPIAHGRASNRFTGLAVKETSMNQTEYERRVKAFLGEMAARGVPPETAAGVLASQQRAEKTADGQGIAYKDAQTVYALPDGTPAIIVGGQLVALKAMPMAEDKAAMPPEEMIAAGETEADDGMAELEDDAAGVEVIGDMDPEAFKSLLKSVLGELMGDYSTQLNAMDEQLKAMGYERRTKEAQQGQELAALKSQAVALEARIKELEGDIPPARRGERATEQAQTVISPEAAAAALKAATAQQPAHAATPLSGMAAATWPELYTNGSGQ
jgi:hypothetical protein